MEPKLAHSIANRLEGDIVTGRLRPGEMLHQENLASRFGVSRQPIRAALEILGARDLAERRPDRSVVVAGLPSDKVDEIVAVRRLLEPEALALALDRLTDLDFLKARHALERFDIEPDPARLAEHDLDFHMSLYAPCGNRTLLDMIEKLRRTNIRAYLGQPLGSETRAACIEAHHDLLEACRRRDREGALTLLSVHFDIVKDRTS